MPYIPTVPFRRLISPSNFIGPSQPPTDTILSSLAPHIDTTGIMTLFLPNSSASNAQQQRLLLPPPSVTLPIQHLSEPFTTPPSTSLNPSALNDPATHSESCFIESTLMGLMFLNLDDGQWDGDDSDESPNHRNPRGMLLDYMEIYRDL